MSSVSDAGEGVTQGGSANIGEEEVSVKDIVANESREKLAQAIKSDSTLAAARALADQLTVGYHWTEGLLFRTRLNVLGDKIEQLCLPVNYRARCLSMAHEDFGHAGRNKMCLHIKRFFYLPSMTADVLKDCKSCDKCQRYNKQTPKPMLMQEREIVTLPSERVCVDIVGPFPTGFRYLLTYVDMATRWPEAIPLKRTTTKIIIDQLNLIFCRNGFPSTSVSNN